MGFIPDMQAWSTIWKSVKMAHHIKIQKISYMIMSTEAEKGFDKIQHHCVVYPHKVILLSNKKEQNINKHNHLVYLQEIMLNEKN